MSSSSAATNNHYFDSHGDYQADDESGYFLPYSSKNNNDNNNNNRNSTPPLPLFQHQESLPRFPVPTVADTIQRLKPSCLPLAADEREKQRFIQACDRFPEQVRELQRGLEDRALTQENWLQVWWNQLGYLGFRDPSPINVNYFFQLPKNKSNSNSNSNSKNKNKNRNTNKAAGRTLGQLERGARVLHSARAYSELVKDGSLPQEAIGKQRATPLCSSMYKYLFHSCRIPKPNQDVYRIYQSRHSPNPCSDANANANANANNADDAKKPNSFPNHAVVSVRGHYFSVDLTDPSTGRPHSVAELELALEECVEHAALLSGDDGTDASADASVDAVASASVVRNLGILTAAHRDEWATNRAKLLDVVPGMDTALETLESGLLLLVLDGNENNNDNDDKTKQITHVDSLSQNARSYLMGTEGRWYDKSLQFIVTPSGDLGLNGEHSMMDGMPVVGLCQYILRRETATETATETETASSTRSPPRVKPVFANDTILAALSANQGLAATRAMVDKATADFNELRGWLDLEVQSFRGYGASWIKSHARCSPDAFVQMAIQLAVGKLAMHSCDPHGPNHGHEHEHEHTSTDRRYLPWATYESTQVRSYRYGRTETTRSVSPQSAEWVESMLHGDLSSNPNSMHRSDDNNNNDDNDDNHQSKQRNLFRKATDAHVDYIRKASSGGGVDRHLFGLQMIRAEREQQSQSQSQSQPEVDLFGDPLFVRSKAWRVSTSTLPVNPGFGPVVVPEGVGIAYDVQDDHIYFTCTSYRGLAPALSHFLEEALVDMREMVLESSEGENRNGNGRSRL